MHGVLKVRTTAEQQEAKRIEREKKLKKLDSIKAKIFEKKKNNEFDEEILELTGGILSSIPDFLTLWNYRRKAIEKIEDKIELQKLCENELRFAKSCLQVNPKSYGSWHHLCFVMKYMPNPDWKKELDLCSLYLEYDERNFHCWDYRRFVVKNGCVSADDEIEFTSNKIASNFSNYSSWQYRSRLLPEKYPDPSQSRGIQSDILMSELDLVQNAFFTDPNDQSAWFYYRWLLTPDSPTLKLNFLQSYKQGDNLVIIVIFSKPVNKNKLSLKNNDELINTNWINISQDDIFIIHKCQVNDICMGNLSLYVDDQLQFSTIDVEKTRNDGFIFSEFTTGRIELSVDILKSQLENIQQLHDMEEDNKWVLITLIFLLMKIDQFNNYSELVNEYLEKLLRLDPSRKRYYQDLRSKIILEFYMKNYDITDVNLSNKELTSTKCNPISSFLLAKNIDLSNNKLTSIDNSHFWQNAEKINLSGNQLTNVTGIEHVLKLSQLDISNNNIKDIDELQNLKLCSNLSVVNLNGNPIQQVDNWQELLKNISSTIKFI
ncbi:DgyrCDS5538 [Dimorphilus gyrociliatus]|uniref:Geranylgeranyl transferase type-2 subunit alpha n=1 Tax=Dimorphilus gyrociliatus TaxID=2664684 RepID=A0A7I8VLS8_9ANNE|nr:DgyrCDS5538 [Dimorphilus gyrociliatus]